MTRGFTLVELILVMVILTVVMAIAVPSIARSFRQRNLEQEAARLLAVTEYGRDEAVSEGAPMSVWIEPERGVFGVDAEPGFVPGDVRRKHYALGGDIHFDLEKTPDARDGRVEAARFAPDGNMDADGGVDSIRIANRWNSTMTVARTQDGLGYEIAKEAK